MHIFLVVLGMLSAAGVLGTLLAARDLPRRVRSVGVYDTRNPHV